MGEQKDTMQMKYRRMLYDLFSILSVHTEENLHLSLDEREKDEADSSQVGLNHLEGSILEEPLVRSNPNPKWDFAIGTTRREHIRGRSIHEGHSPC